MFPRAMNPRPVISAWYPPVVGPAATLTPRLRRSAGRRGEALDGEAAAVRAEPGLGIEVERIDMLPKLSARPARGPTVPRTAGRVMRAAR